MSKNELDRGGKLLLLNPEKYKGYACHPTEDRTIRQVISATIERATDMNHWYDLEIVFEGDHIFKSSSATIGGCKRIFAFQCSAGSKWEKEQLTNNKMIMETLTVAALIEKLRKMPKSANVFILTDRTEANRDEEHATYKRVHGIAYVEKETIYSNNGFTDSIETKVLLEIEGDEI